MEELEVVNDPTKGRCLVTRKQFIAGQVILEQEPYVAVLDEKSRSKRCDSCFKRFSRLNRCSACKLVRYCSVDCQRLEWKLHREECKHLVRCERTLPPTLQLMLRLLIKRKLQAENVIPSTTYDNYDLVLALQTHYSSVDDEQKILFAQMANLVRNVVQVDYPEIKEIVENFCRFSCNAHTICDEELKPVGTGLYPYVSIINHSCSPNAVVTFQGKRAFVRAVQAIETGSEITVSYIELGAATATRRKTLSSQYFFHCCCSRCIQETEADRYIDGILEGIKCSNETCRGYTVHEKDELSDHWRCELCGATRPNDQVEALKAEIEPLFEKANELYSSKDLLEARKMFEKIEKLQRELWHCESVPLMNTRNTLFQITIDTLSWEASRQWCRLMMDGYKRAYSYKHENHPLLGLQYYFLGKLEWFGEKTFKGLFILFCLCRNAYNHKAAMEALSEAQKILTITHGPNSKLVQEAGNLLHDARLEAHSSKKKKHVTFDL